MTHAETELDARPQPLRDLVRRTFDDRALRRLYELGERAEATERPLCLSLYLPMRAADPEHNWLQLKNGLATISRELSDEQQATYADLLDALASTLPDERALEMPDGTLGIFACSEGREMFFFEEPHSQWVQVANYFDLVPFAQLVRDHEPIFLVALTFDSLRLYRLHGAAFERVGGGEIPERLEDMLGEELSQDGIKGHMGQRASQRHEGMIFHGHGAGGEGEKKREALQYFSRVDDKLCDLVGRKRVVILMGTSDVLAIFRQQTCLKEEQIQYEITGSPAHLDDAALREKAILARSQLRERWAKKEIAQLQEKVERHELVTNPSKLAKAAREGRILALYVGERMAKSRRSAGKHARKVIDLSNRSVAELARMVMKLGGRVRPLPPGFRTPHGARVAAVLRY